MLGLPKLVGRPLKKETIRGYLDFRMGKNHDSGYSCFKMDGHVLHIN